MAVYYKFKSVKDYASIPIDGHFITVASLKEKIYEIKQLGRGTDYDLVVTNAQTNEEYLDEEEMIAKNTSVLIGRIPGPPRMPIVATPVSESKMANEMEGVQSAKSNFSGAGLSFSNHGDGSEYDDFGDDLYEVMPVVSNNQNQDAHAPSRADEDSKIQALIDTPALQWQQHALGGGRGFGCGMGGRGRGFGGFGRKTLPPGYVCDRCKTPGHFIKDCPTNGDPKYDIKRVKPPTGIPKSMLVATPHGSYALPSGAVAVLKPDEAAFEKEMEGMPSTCTFGDVPPELHCPLCKQVMKDSVLTSKCCYTSFCDKCIRDDIISKAVCVCGATNVLADDLLPNMTLRDTINRILESNNSSGAQYMESAPPAQIKIAASKAPPQKGELVVEDDQVVSGKGKVRYDSKSMMEPASQGTADDQVEQKQVPGEAEVKKKKKKKKVNNMPSEIPPPYNPYWNGMDAFYGGGYMGGGYGYGFGGGGMFPFGASGLMMPPFMPPPPQRGLSELEMGMNGGPPPAMSREDFEAELKWKRKRGASGRQVISDDHDVPSKRKSPSDGHDHQHSQQHMSHRRSESSSTARKPPPTSDLKPAASTPEPLAVIGNTNKKETRQVHRKRQLVGPRGKVAPPPPPPLPPV